MGMPPLPPPLPAAIICPYPRTGLPARTPHSFPVPVMSDPPAPDVLDHLALALVPGLGPKLTAALLARFGTAAAARQATVAQLRTVPLIGDKLATSFAEALR